VILFDRKTESTKIVLGYLTKVSSKDNDAESKSSIMNKILSTNPILEALGNAKTNRNKNSSRFGKFIQMSFDARGRLVGGVISTYLLEKVRLPSLQPGERNYHIFYQMASGGSAAELREWGFTETGYDAIRNISYVSQGGVVDSPDLDDVDDFRALREAFYSMEISSETQSFLFNILAGILHIGQLQFDLVDGNNTEGSALSLSPESQYHLAQVCRLWCVKSEDVEKTLTTAIMPAVRNEMIEKKLTPMQASNSRDALVKAVYARLFDWIVSEINRTIEADEGKTAAHIGVLDIFG
jgi:myosin heavy subunit